MTSREKQRFLDRFMWRVNAANPNLLIRYNDLHSFYPIFYLDVVSVIYANSVVEQLKYDIGTMAVFPCSGIHAQSVGCLVTEKPEEMLWPNGRAKMYGGWVPRQYRRKRKRIYKKQ